MQQISERIITNILTYIPSSLRDRVEVVRRKGYFAIRMDENHHRVLCKLYDNEWSHSLGIYNEHNVETRFKLRRLDEVARYSRSISERARKYE